MFPLGSAFAGAAKQYAIAIEEAVFPTPIIFAFIGKFEFDDTEDLEEFVVTFARLRYLQNKSYAQ